MDELLDHAPCGYLSFTDAGIIVDINSTLLEILEYTRDDIKNQKFELLLTISSQIFFQTHFFPLLKLHGAANEIFFSLRTKSKQDIPVLVNAIRQEWAGSHLNVCIFVVVTQRQRYEDEIIQAKRAAEAALHNNEELTKAKNELERRAQELDQKISQLEQKNREHHRVNQILFHDLWEPLRKIFTFTDLLMQENITAQKEFLVSRINAAAARMGSLLRSLQEFVAVDTLDETVVQVDLNEVITKAKWAIDKDQKECEIISTTLPVIEGYPQQLGLLFSHLIDNSIKFCRPELPPTIYIKNTLIQHNRYRVSKDKYRYVDFVKIVYTDNSQGFDNTYSRTIFRLLSKLDSASSGAGVGLAVCQKVVENHFGSITVQSQIGEGVTFTILLPFQQQFFASTSVQIAHGDDNSSHLGEKSTSL